jgi:predicted DNA-binding protein YlxM (UPF0122 family)
MAELDYKKEEFIKYVMLGLPFTDISKKLEVSRQALYNWIKLPEVKAELDRRRQEIVKQGNNYILNELRTNIDIVKEIASDKTALSRDRLNASTYLIDRIMGKTTTKIENSDSKGEDDSTPKDILEEEFKEVDNE